MEEFFQTDMDYIMENSSWLSLDSTVDSVASLLMAIAFANLIPKEVYGSYQYVTSLASFFAVFSLAKLGPSIVRSVSRGFEGVLDSSLRVKLRWGLLSLVGGLFVSGYYFFNDNLILSLSFLIAGFLMPLKRAFMMYAPFLRGKKNFPLLAKAGIIQQVVATIVLVLTLIYSDSLVLLLFAYYGIWTLLAMFFFYYTKNAVESNDKTDDGVMSYGKHLSAIEIISRLSGKLNEVLLWHFVGPVSLATYSFGIKPVREIRSFMFSNIKKIAFPKFSERSMTKLRKTLPLKVLKTLIFLVPVVLIYIFAAPYLFRILFPNYLDAIIISQVLVITLLFKPSIFLEQALKAQKKKYALYISGIFKSILRIVVLVPLVYFYGIWGVVYTIFIVQFLSVLLVTILFFKS